MAVKMTQFTRIVTTISNRLFSRRRENKKKFTSITKKKLRPIIRSRASNFFIESQENLPALKFETISFQISNLTNILKEGDFVFPFKLKGVRSYKRFPFNYEPL